MTLTKASDKFLCLVYAIFLKRVKNGTPRSDAMEFYISESWRSELFPDLSDSDYRDILHELSEAFAVESDMAGNFSLSHSALVYMENRFKTGLKEVLDYVSSAFSVVGGIAAFFI